MELIFMTIKLIFSLLVVLILILGLYKITGNKINDMQKSKYIRVIERTQIAKDTMISVVKVGNKGYVIINSPNHTEKLEVLSDIEISELEEKKRAIENGIEEKYSDFYKKIREKLKKEDTYEK